MPLRRSRVDALDVIAYRDGIVRLDLRVGSGTYVRSIADALGGHCRTLRRTEVGPFRVEEADPERLVAPVDALSFLPKVDVTAVDAADVRAGRRRFADAVRVVHEGELVAVDGTVLA
jgi:tRNA U55 pseudouridine synthase TruB